MALSMESQLQSIFEDVVVNGIFILKLILISISGNVSKFHSTVPMFFQEPAAVLQINNDR